MENLPQEINQTKSVVHIYTILRLVSNNSQRQFKKIININHFFNSCLFPHKKLVRRNPLLDLTQKNNYLFELYS